jgi:hypothetical protein
VGGFMVAAGVAVLNMSSAMVLGMLFRYKNLRDTTSRLAGWACAIGFGLLTIYCNALFAAFRTSYQLLSDPSDAAQLRRAFRSAAKEAGQVFWLGMEFGDLLSFILFGTGLLLSVYAFYKGYTFDDKYPGHGPKDRAVKKAQRAEIAAQEAARQRMKEFLQRRRQDYHSVSREPSLVMNAAGERAAALQHALTVYQANAEAIQRDFALLLRSYREANTAIRAAPAPGYFTAFPDIRYPLNEESIERVRLALATAHDGARALRDRYQEALNAKLNTLQRDAATLLDTTFSEFLRSVERDAQEAINRMTNTMQRVGSSVQRTDAY